MQFYQLATCSANRSLDLKFGRLKVDRLCLAAIHDKRHQALRPQMFDLFARYRTMLNDKLNLIHLIYLLLLGEKGNAFPSI
jgi:hypothetical protein